MRWVYLSRALFPTHPLNGHLSISDHCSITPIRLVNSLCLGPDNPFVSTSATISVVGMYFNSTVMFSTFSQMKWCFTSICFDRAWYEGFFVSAIAPRLSQYIIVADLCSCSRFFSSSLSHVASFTA